MSSSSPFLPLFPFLHVSSSALAASPQQRGSGLISCSGAASKCQRRSSMRCGPTPASIPPRKWHSAATSPLGTRRHRWHDRDVTHLHPWPRLRYRHHACLLLVCLCHGGGVYWAGEDSTTTYNYGHLSITIPSQGMGAGTGSTPSKVQWGRHDSAGMARYGDTVRRGRQGLSEGRGLRDLFLLLKCCYVCVIRERFSFFSSNRPGPLLSSLSFYFLPTSPTFLSLGQPTTVVQLLLLGSPSR